MLTYTDFLVRVIDEGIMAATKSYEHDKAKREGAIAGFNACRGKTPAELLALLEDARNTATAARRSTELGTSNAAHDAGATFWYARCFEFEVEWVLNVISVGLVQQGKPPLLPHLPTVRAAMTYHKILSEAVPSALMEMP